MIVRHETSADHAGARRVLSAAFPSAAEADLVDALRAGGWMEIALVAEAAGEIVGCAYWSRLVAPAGALALAPVAVLPARQGQGIGAALIEAGVADARAAGAAAIFVLGEPDTYGGFGFDAAAAAPYACAYAGPFFMALLLDRESGPASGAVVYPAPFAALG